MKARFALLGAVLLLASACADLQAVQDYAKASASVPGYDDATRDFGRRFSRAEIYLDEKGRKLSRSLSPERERAVPDLVAVHRNLQTYMLVLARLAGAQTFDLGKQAEGLQKAIVAFPPGSMPKPPTPPAPLAGSSPSGCSSASSSATSRSSSPRPIRRSRP